MMDTQKQMCGFAGFLFPNTYEIYQALHIGFVNRGKSIKHLLQSIRIFANHMSIDQKQLKFMLHRGNPFCTKTYMKYEYSKFELYSSKATALILWKWSQIFKFTSTGLNKKREIQCWGKRPSFIPSYGPIILTMRSHKWKICSNIHYVGLPLCNINTFTNKRNSVLPDVTPDDYDRLPAMPMFIVMTMLHFVGSGMSNGYDVGHKRLKSRLFDSIFWSWTRNFWGLVLNQ